MVGLFTKPDLQQKLEILSSDAQYDLACACSSKDPKEHRARGKDGQWIYPVTLPNGGKSILFKTLMTNICTNDCKYCPLREDQDLRRCALNVDDTVDAFLDYYHRKKVMGLFLSSGVIKSPDHTMEKLTAVVQVLRTRHKFKGYIHLKVIPGCTDAAVETAAKYASAVSLNIEVPGAKHLSHLSQKKDFENDIIRPMKLIHQLSQEKKYGRLRQTTQFIVGAANETDAEIVKYTSALYDRLKLNRVYFSAYQKDLSDRAVLSDTETPQSSFKREHRLYQTDFLFRKYGFKPDQITYDSDGRLPLDKDPKQIWADSNPHLFPVNANFADKEQLLKVPGLGPITVHRIIKRRRITRLSGIEDCGKFTKLLEKAQNYLVF